MNNPATGYYGPKHIITEHQKSEFHRTGWKGTDGPQHNNSEYINSLLSPTVRLQRQKTIKMNIKYHYRGNVCNRHNEIKKWVLNIITERMVLIDIHKIFYPSIVEYTFFSEDTETFSKKKKDHILGHKANYNKII